MQNFTYFLLNLYRSTLLRIFIFLLAIFLALAVAGYYIFALPWLNRAVSENYYAQTGHQLQHEKLNVQLFQCNLNIKNLKDSSNLWQASDIHLNIGCMQSLRERILIINEINIQQLSIHTHQLDNGLWSFNDIILHQQAIVKNTASKKTSNKGIPLVIKKITLVDSAVYTKILALNNIPLDAEPLNFSISNIDLRGSHSTGFLLKADINKTAQLEFSGKLNLLSLTGEVDADVKNLPFVWFNTALTPYMKLEVLRGAFELHNHIVFVAGVPQTLVSNGDLTNLKLRPTTLDQDVVKWKSLTWKNAEIRFNEKSIHAPLMTIDGLDGQFIIDKNRKTNIQAMLVEQPLVQQPNNLQAKVGATMAADDKPWQFTIDKLAVNNAAIGFYDQSLVPSFTAIVQQFTGDVAHISSDAKTAAIINLAGNIDGYAPVTLHGKGNVLSHSPHGDALFSFKHVDMGALSPYSAEYAGWKINKGLLSADLNYHYEDGKILGKNHVVIDHLKFGEKVRGTHVIDMPLRLGLALLTDEHGIAVLDTEISGTPNDPEFKVGDILMRVLENSFKKMVASPFKFLGKLLNSKEDLGKIQFVSGESQLSDTAKNKIQLLAEALKKRPKMRLSVQGTYDQQSDLLALQEEQVKSALQKNGVSANALATHNLEWAQAVNNQYQVLAAANTSQTVEQKYQELIANEVVDPERFKRLAHERAQAVKQYFVLTLAIADDLIFLNSELNCDKPEQCVSREVIFSLEI